MYNLIKKNNTKILVSLISIMILFLGLTFLVRKGNSSLTSRDRELMKYDQYQDGDENISGTDLVTFDVYFYENIGGTPTKIRGNYLNIKENAELWIDLHVFGEATLKDAKLEFVNGNVKTSGYLYKNSFIPSNTTVPNGGKFNLVSSISGATLNQKITVSANLTNTLDSLSNSTNKIILTGTVVKQDGTEVNITKEVSYTVDWYLDNITAHIGSFYIEDTYMPYEKIFGCEDNHALLSDNRAYYHKYTGENYKLTFKLKTFTTNPFLKSANIKVVIPELNGQQPVDVYINDSNVTFTYDAATQTLTARRDATLDETLITKNAYSYKNGDTYYNDWNIVVEYPKEIEVNSAPIVFDTDTWYEEYEYRDSTVTVNTSDVVSSAVATNFKKPLIRQESELICREVDRFVVGQDVSISTINKTSLLKKYNNEESAPDKVSYRTTWSSSLMYFDKYYEDTIQSLTLSDVNPDKSDENSFENISNYKSILVYNAGYWLGSSGYIKIIDNKTDEVIHILTALDWDNYYTFTEDVSSIRLETSPITNIDAMDNHYRLFGWTDNNTLSLFTVYANKEIDSANLVSAYDLATFDAMSYLTTYLSVRGTRVKPNGSTSTTGLVVSNASAPFKTLQSATVDLETNKTTINSTIINNVLFTVNIGDINDVVSGYKDADYLLVLPEWVLDVEVNSITPSTTDVKIMGYEKTTINGRKCIKISTKNANELKYSMILDADITPDARQVNSNGRAEIYALNPSVDLSDRTAQDIYDIDLDNDTTEEQNYGFKALTLAAPNEVITTTTILYQNASNDDVTVVSPMVADVNPLEDNTDAKIEIGITNNSLYPTQDFRIIGKIGFVGNTYQIGDGDLGSEYNVTMYNTGIVVPTELEDDAIVYYSDQEAPTDDLNKASNNWKKKNQVTDFSTIKTYMIVINDYTLNAGETVKFTYDIDIPNNTSGLNKKTYFTHGVYYNIVTDSGLLSTSVGGAKLGINLARRYDLELVDYKKSSDRTLNGSKYIITHYDAQNNVEDQKILTTDANGYAKAKDLYAGFDYEIKQVNVKYPYILDEDVKTINVVNGANDVLTLQTNGEFKTATLTNDHLVNIELENDVRFDLILTDVDLDTAELIPYSKFRITGKGYESGKEIYTNENGQLSLNGLYIDEEYEIEQLSVNKYILTEKFTVKLIRDTNGDVKISIKKFPSIGSLVNTNNSFSSSNDSDGKYYSHGYYSNRWYEGYIPIDLTGLTGNYTLFVPYKYYANYSNSKIYFYLTDDYSTYGSYFLYKSVDTSSSSDMKIAETSEYYDTTSYQMKPLVGGKVYYLRIRDYKYSSSFYLYQPWVELPNGESVEYFPSADDQNVATYENVNATQSITDSNGQDAPVLNVLVKNKAIPKYNLVITKKNAETGEPLANAQYKITGPGLPNGVKYFTTDANGQATIELNKGIYALDQYGNRINVINDIDYSSIEYSYEIEEVAAPIGYTLDSKKVAFKAAMKLENGTVDDSGYPTKYETDLATESNNSLLYDILSDAEFRDVSWDNANNTLNVSLYDFPLISITKKDSETGEPLPNTLFAINKLEKVNGNEVLTPAFDSKGEVVGTKVTINNREYYVVSTDDNGKIGLDLGAGQYRIQEVQAADEKYEINNVVYYFGVGETILYQGPGVEIADTIAVPGYPQSAVDSINVPKYIKTADDGLAYLKPNSGPTGSDYYLVKEDKDGNIEWQVNAMLNYGGSGYYVHYFDDPDRVEWVTYNLGGHAPYALVQSSDGGYFLSYPREGIIAKYDANGQFLWQNHQSRYYQSMMMDKVCRYDENSDANGHVRLYEDPTYDGTTLTWPYKIGYIYDPVTYDSTEIEYFDIHDTNPDNAYYHLNGAYLRDDETYYCHLSSYKDPYTDLSLWEESSWNPGEYYFNGESAGGNVNTFNTYEGGYILATGDGGVILMYRNPYGNLVLADGTVVDVNWETSLIKYDANGDMVGVYSLDNIVYEAEEEYLNRYGITTGHRGLYKVNAEYYALATYPNGDLLFIGTGSANAIKLRFNETTQKFDTIFFTAIGVNGVGAGYLCSSFNHLSEIKLLDNGGFTVAYEGGYSGGSYTSLHDALFTTAQTGDPYFNTELQQLTLNPLNSYETINPVFEFNGEGKLTNIVIAAQQGSVYEQYPDIYKHLYEYNNGASYARLPDGNYLFTSNTQSLIPTYGSGLSQPSVILANGELELIDPETTYLVYLVNKDSEVEWIRQFKGITAYNQWYHKYADSFITSDGKYWLLPAYVSGTEFEDIETGTVYQAAAPSDVNFLKIEILDTISPTGPEAYTLNIDNNRKEYKVTATSNLGGEVVVTNPDNGQEVISTTGATTTLELVKYGDTNKYDITIIPDPTYVVAGVQVNGKDISYAVNPDGTVTIDKITDIKEDKNISIIYARNKSQVIVKHYLKDTTTSVFGDEILIGDEGDPYETEPKQSELYSVATDAAGDMILPTNMTGNYASTPITVIYYYVENEVELKVNYYLDGTDTELAPSNIQRKTLGSTYQTSPLAITNYNLTDTIGDESGTLTRNLTEVTYMYAQSTDATITIRYVDKATNQDIIDPIVKTVPLNDVYSTDDPVTIPSNYRFTEVVGKTAGLAENSNIEVIYYYEVIPFNVSVDKKINSVLLNGEKQTITDSKNVSISPAKKDNLIVYYEINLKNTGEIKANFTVVEGDIPGFEIYDKGNFEKTNNGYELTAELEPGEEKTYRIGYKWNQKDYGISTNKVELKEVTNDKGFAEPDALDNISTATVETKIPKDVLDDDTFIPNTLDNIPAMIGLFIASIIGIVVSLILIRKKRMN